MKRAQVVPLASLVAIFVLGCGTPSAAGTTAATAPSASSAAPASIPPAQQPSATVEASTPTPTPSPAATPAPTRTPIPLAVFLRAKLPAPMTGTQLNAALQTLCKTDPQARGLCTQLSSAIATCITGKLYNLGNPVGNKAVSCRVVILNLYRSYLGTNDAKIYRAAEQVFAYAISPYGVGSSYRSDVETYLTQVLGS